MEPGMPFVDFTLKSKRFSYSIEMNTKIPCVQLIDFGVSIDMKLFPEDAKFKKVSGP